MAFAIFLPLILPGLREHGIFGHGAAPGHGAVSVAPPSPLVEMRSQLDSRSAVPVLTYRTTAQNPSQQYLQVYVLNNYDPESQQFTLPAQQPHHRRGQRGAAARAGPRAGHHFNTTTTTDHHEQDRRQGLPELPAGAVRAADHASCAGTGWLETDPDADGVRVPAGRRACSTR